LKSILYAGAVVGLFALAACNSSTSATAPLPVAPTTNDATAQGTSGTFELPSNVRRACEASADPNIKSCDALVRTDVLPNVPAGYGPSDLQSAYVLPSSTQGSGQTIAVVDAYDDPNAEADLGVYRSTFGLPACTTSNGCFSKVNQNGQQGSYPAPNAGWAVEESLDVDMVSAGCPNCHIILVESKSPTTSSLGTGVNAAVKLGANAVSNSYGGRGTGGSSYYNHPGTIITASAGDSGYGVSTPAGFPTVVAVGGTTLHKGGGSRGWTETVWRGTGSGCERTLAKPSWQKDSGCKGRTMNDVAAVADPNTGVAFYDSYKSSGWGVVGGTSVSSPLVASIYGLAGNESSLDAAQSLYASGASLYDIVSGSNGTCHPSYLCTAGPGYDGPTGNGTPNGVTAF